MTQFFTSFGITQYTEGAISTKNFLLFHSIVLLFLMNETREVIVKNWECVTQVNEMKNAIMQVTYFSNCSLVNVCLTVILITYWKKVTT